MHSYLFDNSVTNPAVSTAWVISNEGFLKDKSIINLLKLKAGYGIKTIVPTFQMDAFSLTDNIANEIIKEYNFGLQWSILNNRISGNIDYYNLTTGNLIMKYGVPSPPSFYDYGYVNLAKILNKGFEIGIQAIPVNSKNFIWKLFVNYSTNKSKFNFVDNPPYYHGSYETYGSIDDPISMSVYRLADGEPIGNFFWVENR